MEDDFGGDPLLFDDCFISDGHENFFAECSSPGPSDNFYYAYNNSTAFDTVANNSGPTASQTGGAGAANCVAFTNAFDAKPDTSVSAGIYADRQISLTSSSKIDQLSEKASPSDKCQIIKTEPEEDFADHDYVADDNIVDAIPEYGISNGRGINAFSFQQRHCDDGKTAINIRVVDDEVNAKKISLACRLPTALLSGDSLISGSGVISSSLSQKQAVDGPPTKSTPTRTSNSVNASNVRDERRPLFLGFTTIPEQETWLSGTVTSRGDGALSPDDTSSTTSESCSNSGYLSSGSPVPTNNRHGNYAQQQPYPGGRYHHNSGLLNLNLRARSKMHELALKHKLISEQDPRSNGCVILSPEERRTLVQEGLPMPTKLPLSKPEEEALKIVRRKIKNKLSAQESRRKRKEYMETLEQQIQGYQSENSSLRRRVENLEKTNQNLIGQLKKLQDTVLGPSTASAIVAGSSTRSGPGVHTVSLTALFLLFVVMIPAMPVCPSIFRNVIMTNSFLSKSISTVDDVPSVISSLSSSPDGYSYAASRVLSTGSDRHDCDIPYSPDYFENLKNHQDDPDGTQPAPSADEGFFTSFFKGQVFNFSEKSYIENSENGRQIFAALPSAAVCEMGSCHEMVSSTADA